MTHTPSTYTPSFYIIALDGAQGSALLGPFFSRTEAVRRFGACQERVLADYPEAVSYTFHINEAFYDHLGEGRLNSYYPELAPQW